jgi:YcxB-like protein
VHIVGELKMDFRGYRRLVLPAFGRAFPVVQALAVILVIWMAVMLAADGFSTTRTTMLLGGIGGAVGAEIAVLIGWRRTAKMADEPWRYVVTDSTVGIHTPHSDVTTRWDGITGARIRRHVWLLRLANKALVPIPRAAFTADDALQIDALAAAAGARSR